MPIYAYKCASCGHRQDVLQKLSDPVLSSCPACGAEAFAKQITAAGFQLKGSGWYVTDFRNNGSASAAKGESAGQGEAAANGGKSEGGDKGAKVDAGAAPDKSAKAATSPSADATAGGPAKSAEGGPPSTPST